MLKKYFKLSNVVAIAICLTGMTIFSSCDKGDDNGSDNTGQNTNNPNNSNNPETNIIGTWVFEEGTITELAITPEMPEVVLNQIKTIMESVLNEEFIDMVWNFKDAGKCTIYYLEDEPEDYDEATYSISGSTLTITSVIENDFVMTGQYSISDNKLYFDLDMLDYLGDGELAEGIEITEGVYRLTFNKK